MIQFKCDHISHIGKKRSHTITFSLYEDLNLHDLILEFRYFLLAIGYQPENINEYIEAE